MELHTLSTNFIEFNQTFITSKFQQTTT